MTRPALPATRAERIALARDTIATCCLPDEQLDPEVYRVYTAETLVEFRVQVPDFRRSIALNHRVADAIMIDAGFPVTAVKLDSKVCRELAAEIEKLGILTQEFRQAIAAQLTAAADLAEENGEAFDIDDALRAEIDAAERALWDALFPRPAAASVGGGQ